MNNKGVLIEFSKVIKDLLSDLLITFSDKTEDKIKNNTDYICILKFNILENENCLINDNYENNSENIEFMNSVNNVFEYCKKIFPERFFIFYIKTMKFSQMKQIQNLYQI